MNERLRHFMAGRYGNDNLNRLLSILAVVFMVVSMFAGHAVMYLLALLLLVLCFYRMLSKNLVRRRKENYDYLSLREKPARWLRGFKRRVNERKTHCFYKCPKCRVWIRVPKGRGLIAITYPKCHTSFDKKT